MFLNSDQQPEVQNGNKADQQLSNVLFKDSFSSNLKPETHHRSEEIAGFGFSKSESILDLGEASLSSNSKDFGKNENQKPESNEAGTINSDYWTEERMKNATPTPLGQYEAVENEQIYCDQSLVSPEFQEKYGKSDSSENDLEEKMNEEKLEQPLEPELIMKLKDGAELTPELREKLKELGVYKIEEDGDNSYLLKFKNVDEMWKGHESIQELDDIIDYAHPNWIMRITDPAKPVDAVISIPEKS